MEAIFYGIADMFESLFTIMPKLGNIPNTLLVISGFIAFLIWTSLMVKFRREGENE